MPPVAWCLRMRRLVEPADPSGIDDEGGYNTVPEAKTRSDPMLWPDPALGPIHALATFYTKSETEVAKAWAQPNFILWEKPGWPNRGLGLGDRGITSLAFFPYHMIGRKTPCLLLDMASFTVAP